MDTGKVSLRDRELVFLFVLDRGISTRRRWLICLFLSSFLPRLAFSYQSSLTITQRQQNSTRAHPPSLQSLSSPFPAPNLLFLNRRFPSSPSLFPPRPTSRSPRHDSGKCSSRAQLNEGVGGRRKRACVREGAVNGLRGAEEEERESAGGC